MYGLGQLEAAVMDTLWQAAEPMRVRQVLERLDTGKQLAYTTVMTVLDNLYHKEWVTRDREGNAYSYRPSLSREEAAARVLHDVLDSSGDPEAVLLHFVAAGSPEQTDLLRNALRRKRGRRT